MLLAVLFHDVHWRGLLAQQKSCELPGHCHTTGVLWCYPSAAMPYHMACLPVMGGVFSDYIYPWKQGSKLCTELLLVCHGQQVSAPPSVIFLSQEFLIWGHQRQPSATRFLWTNQPFTQTNKTALCDHTPKSSPASRKHSSRPVAFNLWVPELFLRDWWTGTRKDPFQQTGLNSLQGDSTSLMEDFMKSWTCGEDVKYVGRNTPPTVALLSSWSVKLRVPGKTKSNALVTTTQDTYM